MDLGAWRTAAMAHAPLLPAVRKHPPGGLPSNMKPSRLTARVQVCLANVHLFREFTLRRGAPDII
jgi:hypothetical protein